jgi:hypothetical protein
MSTGTRIPWKEANAIAQDCVAQLAPHCPDKPTHVWVFDVNRRVYPYRKHWVKHLIIGQTSRSWLIGPTWKPTKIPKRGANPSLVLFSEKM